MLKHLHWEAPTNRNTLRAQCAPPRVALHCCAEDFLEQGCTSGSHSLQKTLHVEAPYGGLSRRSPSRPCSASRTSTSSRPTTASARCGDHDAAQPPTREARAGKIWGSDPEPILLFEGARSPRTGRAPKLLTPDLFAARSPTVLVGRMPNTPQRGHDT